MLKKLILALLFLPAMAHAQLWSGLLSPTSGGGACTLNATGAPAGCAIDWSVAGIPGGGAAAVIAGAVQSGTTITSTGSQQLTAINSALASCGGTSGQEKYVKLAAGTFLTNGIIVVPSYCFLIGAGADQTIIQDSGTNGAGIVQLGAGGSPNGTNDTAITGGLSAGSTSITVASAAHISIGSNLSISELNSQSNNINTTGSEGFCNFCDNYGGYRSSGQNVLVTGVSGTTITISPGLYWTYGTTLPSWTPSHIYYAGDSITSGGNSYKETALPGSPYNCTSGSGSFSTTDNTCTWVLNASGSTTTAPLASPYTPNVESGVVDLQLYTVNAGSTTLVGPNVQIAECQYCFVKGIEANYTDADYVYAFFMYGGEISNNYFTGAILHGPGSYDSALQISTGTSQVLITNNIFERGHVGILLEHQTSGNVESYNYMMGQYDSGSPAFVIGGFDFHGSHPEYNLQEGNVGIGMYEDSVWGTSANNSFFRNWFKGSQQVNYPEGNTRATVTGNGTTMECNGLTTGNICFPFQASRTMQISYLSTNTNAIGNVVGSLEQSNNIGYSSGVTKYNSGTTWTDALRWPTTRIYDTTVYGWSAGYGESSDDGTWPLDSSLAWTTTLPHANYSNIASATVYYSSLTHTLPASFYLSGKPSWWGSLPFPSIGPDVTGLSGPGGHASLTAANPAMNCYLNTMGGTAGGAGSPLTFNENRCYGSAPVVVPPLSLTIFTTTP